MPQLLHLDHIEDTIFDGNYIQAFDVLAAVADRLMGDRKIKGLHVSEKFDGAPAIVFGLHPETKRYFVGTKSVFNKRIQKIAYDGADIAKFYGDKPELALKLNMVRETLTDHYPDGVYQADIMWTPDSIKIDNTGIHFNPNTITYHQTLDHKDAVAISSKGLGLCVHTKYVGDVLSEMDAHPITKMDLEMFRLYNIDCFYIDPNVDMNSVLVLDQDWKDYVNGLMTKLDSLEQRNIARVALAHTLPNAKNLRVFVNYCIRIGEYSPSVEMYETFLINRNEESMLETVSDNRKHFETVFHIHRMMNEIKLMILRVLNGANQFITTVGVDVVRGEGYVVNYYGSTYKFVDRLEFSRLNFMNKRFEKA